MEMRKLCQLTGEDTRSITPENPTGERGGGARAVTGSGYARARDLGPGWKMNPFLVIEPGQTVVLADIEGSGAIRHIWMTLSENKWRGHILRFYWDGQENPSVECPAGDFFCNGWNSYAPVSSLPVCVNPGKAFNCYWEMPFRTHCKITLENRNFESVVCFYQIDYALYEQEEEIGYFHATFRRSNPLPYKEVHTILDGVKGRGKYVGTYIAWGVHNSGWWGEGEVKFYLDGDREYPTICGTGTEDYFCGAFNFENREKHQYETFLTPYAGLCQILRPDGLYRSQMRFGMYRFHLTDPICFQEELRVTVQALGWREGGRYLPLTDDIASTAFWYQTLPHEPFAALADRDALEII